MTALLVVGLLLQNPYKDAKVENLIKALTNAKDRVAAMEELRARGEEAQEASEKLCELAVDKSEKTREAALDALETVNPGLYPHVAALVADMSSARGDSAADGHLRELRKLGLDAKAAVPVVLAHWKFSKTRVPARAPEDILAQEIDTIAAIGGEHARAQEFLMSGAKTFESYSLTKVACIRGLRTIAENADGEAKTELQKKLVPVVKLLMTGKDENASNVYEVMLLAGNTGRAGKPLIPQLKKFKLYNEERVRDAARAAQAAIESDEE